MNKNYKEPLVLLLAAGFGKRLGNLTKDKPKPLVEIGPYKLIDFPLSMIKRAGFKEVIINLHYLGDQIRAYVSDGKAHGLKVTYSMEDPILDTGGAIKKVHKEAGDRDILVINSDAVFGPDFDLKLFCTQFANDPRDPIASLLLRSPPMPNPFGLLKGVSSNAHFQVVKILDSELKGSLVGTDDFIFTGVHIFSRRVRKYLDQLGDVFCSMKNLYPRFLLANEYIRGELYNGYWNDTGTPERLDDVKQGLASGKLQSPRS